MKHRIFFLLLTASCMSFAQESALLDYNARYYNPAGARFISPDTIIPDPTDPQSLNRYSYVNNRVIGFNDPSGHVPEGPNGAEPQGSDATVVIFIGGATDKFGEYGYDPTRIVGRVYEDYLGKMGDHVVASGYFAHDQQDEILAMIANQRELNPDVNLVILGHSLGGSTALQVGNKVDDAIIFSIDPHGNRPYMEDYDLGIDVGTFWLGLRPNHENLYFFGTATNYTKTDPDWWVTVLGGDYDDLADSWGNYPNVRNHRVEAGHAFVNRIMDNSPIRNHFDNLVVGRR